MKKVKKNLFIFITAMLCLLFVPKGTSITSHAAAGDLVTGSEFNQTIKSFTNSNVTWSTRDYTIKKIIFAKEPSKPANKLQQKSVGDGVTAYYDSAEKTVYVCCKTNKIRFNSHSGDMFCSFEAAEVIDFGKNIIDTTPMTSGSYFFRCCRNVKELDLSQFRTPNLTGMCQMFHCCTSLKKVNVSTLDTSKVTDMQSVFMTCPSLESLDLSNFNTSKVRVMFQMFEYCGQFKTLDLSNFDTSNVENMYRMFDSSSSLTSINISSFKTPKVKDVQEMFYGCKNLKYLDLRGFDLTNVPEEKAGGFLGRCDSLQYVDGPAKTSRKFYYDADTQYVSKCQIGKVAIDDNRDGKPDSAARYNYFLQGKTIHRYLFVDNIAKAEKDKEPEEPNPEDDPAENNETAPSAKVDNPPTGEKSILPMTVTVNGITYYIDTNGIATVTKIDKVKKASINDVTVNGTTYPVNSINANACKENKKISSVTIGKNVAKVDKKAFYKCKKLKKVKITANKSFKVGKNAFKKLHKDAKITVKGVKGKSKQKLIKKLRKQTDAIVK